MAKRKATHRSKSKKVKRARSKKTYKTKRRYNKKRSPMKISKNMMALNMVKLVSKPQTVSIEKTWLIVNDITNHKVIQAIDYDANGYSYQGVNTNYTAAFGINPFCIAQVNSQFTTAQERTVIDKRVHTLQLVNQETVDVDIVLYWVTPRHDIFASSTSIKDLNDCIAQSYHAEYPSGPALAANVLEKFETEFSLWDLNKVLSHFKIVKSSHFVLQPGKVRRFHEVITRPLWADGEYWNDAGITGYGNKSIIPVIEARGGLVHQSGSGTDADNAIIGTAKVRIGAIFTAEYEMYQVNATKSTLTPSGSLGSITGVPVSMQMSNPSNVAQLQ